MADVRDTAVGAFAAGDAITAATTNEGPGGQIGAKERTSNSTGTTTSEFVITLTAQPINTARRIKVAAEVTLRCTNSTGVQVTIHEDDVQIVRRNFWAIGNSAAPAGTVKDNSYHVETPPTYTTSAGTHTYKLYVGVSGSALGQVVLAATSPEPASWLEVLDLGPVY